MSSQNPWDAQASLQNASQFIRNQNMGTLNTPGRATPVLPPRPLTSSPAGNSYSMMPSYSMSSYGGSPYGGGYSSYGMPYRSSLYGSNYGSFGGGYGMYNYNNAFSHDDHERRFIHYAEESSRQTFASVESVVRAFNSLAMMLDNTFFAMTSSFRAILGVAENFGRLRSMFGHIWYSVNIFRFLTWLYRKFRQMLGLKVTKNATSVAWKEASKEAGSNLPSGTPSGGSSWPTLAFLGVIVSAPYIISKFLPKYEDKLDMQNWKSPGIPAKACFDFIATNQNELTIHTNDNIILAPTYLQEEMHLRNTGWAYAVHNGKSGVIPLNYIVINKNNNMNVPVQRASNIKDTSNGKTHQKKVSFGNIEIFDSGEEGIRKESIPVENETNMLPQSDSTPSTQT
ncbi:probable peroxisomal membrane protein PEX13 [Anthonomus grandis grandis]|uniref:probable peroxisomal membrane protein PEX13 n=1 Tax=Anthonomus grandis grandis TaxID=2921223 RepID=UPI0021668340|nr:probable peroxisomal membrane protein PEX13 [Anthonomus grandis grandis]